jgi:hypothetical protein
MPTTRNINQMPPNQIKRREESLKKHCQIRSYIIHKMCPKIETNL